MPTDMTGAPAAGDDAWLSLTVVGKAEVANRYLVVHAGVGNARRSCAVARVRRGLARHGDHPAGMRRNYSRCAARRLIAATIRSRSNEKQMGVAPRVRWWMMSRWAPN